MSATPRIDIDFPKLRRITMLVAVVGIGLCAVAAIMNREQLLHALLVAWLYWLGISVGSLAALMLHNLTGGIWGVAARPVLEAAAMTVPLMAVLFVPIALDLSMVYPWARPDLVASDPILQHKQPYLNEQFFLIRTAGYFIIWTYLLWNSLRLRRKFGDQPTEDEARRMRLANARGLLLYGLTISFAAVDWGMSLEPHWYSAIYGLIWLVGQGLAGLAFATAAAIWVDRRRSQPILSGDQLNDLGNLLLAFTMLWAYMSLCQFLIIWYANLPEEVPWYLSRIRSGWKFVAAALFAFHYVVPFLILISRTAKRNPKTLMSVALLQLFMRWFEQLWLIEPAFNPPGAWVPWLDLLVTVALGGVWLTAVSWRLERNVALAQPVAEGGAH